MKTKTNRDTKRREAHPETSYTAGIDLHSNNLMLGVADESGRRITHSKLPCKLDVVITALSPFRTGLKMIAVESTFNWYWLVDGLRAAGFPVVLANPAAIVQYNGIKHADDKNDAFFLAELLRLNILPTGYIYDPETRPVRDLLRRRMNLVRLRSSLMLSFKSLHHRTFGEAFPLKELKRMEPAQAEALFQHPADRLIASLGCEHIEALTLSILQIEKTVEEYAKTTPYYAPLRTIPGIGLILAMMITMEVGNLSRFKTAGDFASYCRTVDSKRTSNERKKGDNNAKCGNRYLAWAFVEAAQLSRQHNEEACKWFDRKTARRGNIVATKALACKLAKAAWHIMRTGEPCDASRIFSGARTQ